MSKNLRVLLVTVNFILSLMLIPVVFIGGFVYTIYVKIKDDCGLTYKDVCESLMDGIKDGFDNNMRFLKTGDLSEFKL